MMKVDTRNYEMRRLKNKNLKVNSLPLNKTENNDAKDKNSVIKGSVKFILCNETMANDRKTPTPLIIAG